MQFNVDFNQVTNTFNAELSGQENRFNATFDSIIRTGGGLTEEVKQALLDLFQHLAYTDADGQDYYDALYNAFYPPAELVRITAVYTQTSTVFPDTPLDDLKDDLVVTAHYSDGTSEAVTTYTLSGTLTAGTSVVTVTYEDKTTTFNVTVSAPAVLSSISAVYTQSGVVYPTDSLDSLKPDLVVTAHYSDSSTATVTTYTLSGTLTVGTSTITVTYSDKTTTFNVTVTAVPVLDSITAVYTQSGTVYDTDSLDSLKADLVVTAVYTDSSTEVVPSTDYALSGTLTVGTSTITVSYEGKTATFTVTVTEHGITYLYNWDFTQSLIDSVQSKEVTLSAASGVDNASRDSNGLHFNAATQYAYLGQISPVGKTIEIDVASFDFKGLTNHHIRFFTNAQYTTSTSKGLGAICWKYGEGWKSYGWTTETGTSLAWSANFWSADLTGATSAVINAFDGKTVKLVYHSDGHTKDLYLDNVYKGTISDVWFNNYGSGSHVSDKLMIAGMGSVTQNSGDQCYDMTITGVRIYANDL